MPGLLDYVIVIALSLIGGLAGGLIAARIARSRKVLELRIPGGRARDEKRRYIVFEVATSDTLSFDDVSRALEETARRLLGEAGLSQARIKLVDYDPVTRRGIVRVRRGYKWHALAVLSLVRRVGEKKVLVVPLASTGSLRRAREKAGLHRGVRLS